MLLENSNNWKQIYKTSVNALKVTSSQHVPIPEIKVELPIVQHVLAVFVSSIEAKTTWDLAGYLIQKIPIGNALGMNFNEASVAKRKLWLNQINLLTFPEYTQEYYISFEVPSWFTSVNLTIWSYNSEGEMTNDLLLDINTFTSSSVITKNVDAVNSSITLVNANSNRKGLSIWNDSKVANLFLDYENEVSLNSYAVKIGPGGYFEVPFSYTGPIVGIWNIPEGKALIKEFI